MQHIEAASHCAAARRLVGSDGTFRLRVLLDMALIEFRKAVPPYLSSHGRDNPIGALEIAEPVLSAADEGDASGPRPNESTDPLCRLFDVLLLASRLAEEDGDRRTQIAIESALILVGDRIAQRTDAMRRSDG